MGIRTAASLLAAAAVASAAQADSVEIVFNGSSGNLGNAVNVSLHNGLYFQDGSSSKGVWAGQLSHTIDGVDFKTFCTELTQWAGSGQYECVSVDLAPNTLPMGQEKADAIYRLFNATNGGEDIATNAEAAAFQGVIWEIVYDLDGGFGVNSGNVRISGLNSGLFSQYQALATDQQGDSAPRVVAFTSENRQDQLAVVPLPGAAAMAGFGLAGIAVRRRRQA